MKPRVSFYTLGCRLNQSETAVIENTFRDDYRVVDFSKPADVVVINTCTVTENGDADTRRLVRKVNRLNPKARIALIGCQAQVQKEKLTRLPNVRWVVGNEKKMELVSILQEMDQLDTPQVITPAIERKSFTLPGNGIDTRHTRANLKIQDGCDFFCSFCEIPYARGRARSRKFQDILREAKVLADAGHKEIVLTGINLGTYRNQNKTILDVITALEEIKDLHRVRISSIEPTTIPAALIKKMQTSPKLCRHLHIPLQSGSDRILRRMKRKYTGDEFKDFILEAKAKIPELCLGTDCIVGFPDERENDFERTYAFLRDLPFSYFHVFRYSPRYLAKSQDLAHPVDDNLITQRSRRLRELSGRKRRLFYQSLLGSRQAVLFEQQKGDFWFGLTDHYVKIKVHSRANLSNQMRTVRLRSVDDNGVLAGLIDEKTQHQIPD